MKRRQQNLIISLVSAWVCSLCLIGQIGAQQQILPGDTRLSSSDEARSMSPPHWGADPSEWPANNPNVGPGCDTAGRNNVQQSSAPTNGASRFQLPPLTSTTGANRSFQSGYPGPNQNGHEGMVHGQRTFVPQPVNGLPTLPPYRGQSYGAVTAQPTSLSPQGNNHEFQAGHSIVEHSTGNSPMRFDSETGQFVPLERYPIDADRQVSSSPNRARQTLAQPSSFPAIQEDDSAPSLEPSSITPSWDPARPGALPPEGVIIPDGSPIAPQSGPEFLLPGESVPGDSFLQGPAKVTCEDWERGFRQPIPTIRPQVWDDGEVFDFENKKKQYPPMKEILATGRYFGMAEWQALKPFFPGSPAITIDAPGFGGAIQHDFDTEAASRFRGGFESQYGPGIEFQYSQFDHLSDSVSFTSNGVVAGTARTPLPGTGNFLDLLANDPGESLSTRHDLEIHNLLASFFKEVKLPISRVNGMFGFRYVSIAQTTTTSLFNASDVEIDRVVNQTDLRAYGPNLGLEYYRPVGHTPFELVGTFNGSLLFGNRDQVVSSNSLQFSSIGSDEFVALIDFFGGLQYVRNVAEKRSLYARAGITHQQWLGGGNSDNPAGDFGLRGISFGFGINR